MSIELTEYLRELSIAFVPFLFAITVHEFSHGYIAYKLGDDTAKLAGRLTLNPFAHIDILGLLFLIITRLFGWAKPVPVNFSRLKCRKYGVIYVAIAGPVSNFITAAISAILLKLISNVSVTNQYLFNIAEGFAYMLFFSVQINVALGIFNLIPILPLDGGRILQGLLPYNKAESFSKLEPYGFLVILLLLITNVIDYCLVPIIKSIVHLLV